MTLYSIVRESKVSQKKYDVVINMQSCSGADISSYDDSVKDVLGCQRFSEICSIMQAKAVVSVPVLLDTSVARNQPRPSVIWGEPERAPLSVLDA